MIISKAPVRITLAGGGTDISSYYTQREGFLIACGINKYTYVMINIDRASRKAVENDIVLKYFKEERVRRPTEIQHPIFKDVLTRCNWKKESEFVVVSDVPASCGLGTSGAFTVALHQAVSRCIDHNYIMTPREAAEAACYTEIDRLKEPIGKQDQYASAFGGINSYKFHKDGWVEVQPIKVDHYKLKERLLLFDTRIPRRSSDVLTNQVKEMESGGEVLEKLDKAKSIALVTKGLLEHESFDQWGDLLNTYWNLRKTFSSKISNPKIDEAYALARKNGALGGKLQGAGGGGFLMFYAREKHHDAIISALEGMGLRNMEFNFDFNGVQSFIV